MSESVGDEWVPGEAAQSSAEAGAGSDGSQDTGDGSDGDTGDSSLFDRLFSTSPEVDVQSAASELSADGGPEGHFGAFLRKFSGNAGTTAVEHLILAVALWAWQHKESVGGQSDDENRDDSGDEREQIEGDDVL